MSLFSGPQQHAENTPDTWVVVKFGERSWGLTTQDGGDLDRFKTRREALEAKSTGFLARLYERDRRWYAGEKLPGMKTYAQCEQERKDTEARRRRKTES